MDREGIEGKEDDREGEWKESQKLREAGEEK